MSWRPIAVGIAGLALWVFLFYALGIGIGLVWPAYRDAAQVTFQEGSFQLFTTPMLLTNLLVFFLSGYAAGRVSTVIAKRRGVGLALSMLLLIYAVAEHYWLLWEKLPHWYNLIVPIVMAGSVWVGGRPAAERDGGDKAGVRGDAA
jgi:hypothetical protein